MPLLLLLLPARLDAFLQREQLLLLVKLELGLLLQQVLLALRVPLLQLPRFKCVRLELYFVRLRVAEEGVDERETREMQILLKSDVN